MGDRRKALKAKIAALRAKTTKAGCTEDEAMAAAALAAELMGKHGLDEADLVMDEAVAAERTEGQSWRGELVGTIAFCTNTAVMLRQGGWHFVGLVPGPDIAVYLREVTFRAVEGELRAFKAGRYYRRKRSLTSKRDAAADFRFGLVSTLKRRLISTFGPNHDQAQIAQAMAARDRLYGEGTDIAVPERKMRFHEAFYDGRQAGHDVALNHGVGGGETRKLIEGAA